MESLRQDVLLALRLLWKDKAFTVTALLILTLCLAANVVLFTVVNAVVLRPLPFPDAERILLMYNAYPGAGHTGRGSTGVPDYFDRLRDVAAFEAQALYRTESQSVGEAGQPERVLAYKVTPQFFGVLGVSPALGRDFVAEDGELGQEQKVILSHGIWQRLYGGETGVIGRELRMSGRPFTVVGVMPEGFEFLNPEVQMWIPAAFTAEEKSDDARHSNSWQNIGRLKPGATLEQAQAQVDAVNAANLERFPHHREVLTNAGFHTVVTPLHEETIREVRPMLLMLWGGALFVLLIGAANLANLALVRARIRLKELVTRVALGASRWRVARQLLTESLVLTCTGGALGLLVGSQALRLLERLGIEEIPRASEIDLDGRVLLFTLALAVAAGLGIGLLSAAGILRADLNAVLREEGRSSSGGRGMRWVRHALVVVQVGVAFTLLAGAGLLLASFRHVIAADPGFRAAGVLTASVALPPARYPEEPDRVAFVRQLLERVRALPGVAAAGTTSTIPFGGSYSDSVILAEDYVMAPGESLISPSQLRITPGYLEAMGVKLVRGRYFEEGDREDAPGVVIVDEKLASRFWPGKDPLGRRMFLPTNPNDLLSPDENTEWLTVVGVVRSTRLRGPVEDSSQNGAYYFPYAQSAGRNFTLAVRAATAPEGLTSAIRGVVTGLDPELPIFSVQTMEERTQKALVTRRSPMLLAMGFAGLALLLSAIGIYGVLAYLVAQRRREIGIRMALGSSARRVFELILREGAVLMAAGFAVGALGVVAVRQVLQTQLYEVTPTDPAVLGAVGLVLSVVGLAACAIPAFRATSVNPVEALIPE